MYIKKVFTNFFFFFVYRGMISFVAKKRLITETFWKIKKGDAIFLWEITFTHTSISNWNHDLKKFVTISVKRLLYLFIYKSHTARLAYMVVNWVEYGHSIWSACRGVVNSLPNDKVGCDFLFFESKWAATFFFFFEKKVGCNLVWLISDQKKYIHIRP